MVQARAAGRRFAARSWPGLLAALMSSLAGAFNASSTLFTIDLYKKKWNPGASDSRLVWVGRMATVAMTIIALVWIPVIRNAPRGLYDYLQGIQGYLAPPIFVVFFLGVFWKRLNAAGCMAALARRLLDGHVPAGRRHADHVGSRAATRMATRPNSFLWIVNNIYFQYYSLLIFLVSSVGDGRRELRDGRAAAGTDSGPDVRHDDRRAEAQRRERVGRRRRRRVRAS